MWYSVHFTMSGSLVTTDNSKSECGFQTERVTYNSTMDKKNQIQWSLTYFWIERLMQDQSKSYQNSHYITRKK